MVCIFRVFSFPRFCEHCCNVKKSNEPDASAKTKKKLLQVTLAVVAFSFSLGMGSSLLSPFADTHIAVIAKAYTQNKVEVLSKLWASKKLHEPKKS